eukprot:SM000028S10142  [mRNA]  locus=s28:599100:604019:+ [translate_table: standard]
MDTGDTAPCVLLFFDQRRFVFNAGEGLQRFCTEHKVRLSRIDHVFLTRVCSETAGGLPGLLLTLANIDDVGRGVKLWGPSNLSYLLDAMRTFVPGAAMVHTQTFGEAKAPPGPLAGERDGRSNGRATLLPPDVVDSPEELLHEDENVQISAVVLRPRLLADVRLPTGKLTLTTERAPTTPPPDSGRTTQQVADLGFGAAEPWLLGFPLEPDAAPAASANSDGSECNQKPSAKRARAASQVWTTEQHAAARGVPSVVYICRMPELKGKFDPDKARALGLRPSAKYAQLQRGASVVSDDGTRTIHPGDVMGPSELGAVLLLVDCPTAGHVPALVASSALEQLRAAKDEVVSGANHAEAQGIGSAAFDNRQRATCVVHLGPQPVLDTMAYRQWMASLGPQASHILAGHGRQGHVQPILASSAKITARLNLICPGAFPIFRSATSSSLLASPPGLRDIRRNQLQELEGIGPVQHAQNLMKFRFSPKAHIGLDLAAVPEQVDLQEVCQQLIRDNPDVVAAAERVARLWQDNEQERQTDTPARSLAEPIRESQRQVSGNVSGMTRSDHERQQVFVEEPWLMESQRDAAAIHGTCDDAASSNASSRDNAGMAATAGADRTSGAAVPDCLKDVGREEMELVFLGTGSSQPSKYRNVSSIYVNLFHKGGLLLDCGEGTYAQLKRRHGPENADALVAGLKLVWISHIHADHHAGLARILTARCQLLGGPRQAKPIVVVGPKPLRRFLDAYEKVEDLCMTFVDCSQTTYEADKLEIQNREGDNGKRESDEAKPSAPFRRGGLIQMTDRGGKRGTAMQNYWLQPGFNLQDRLDMQGRKGVAAALSELGLARLVSIPVVHCAHAYGVLLEAAPIERRHRGDLGHPCSPHVPTECLGWKVVYSGDTRPCEALVEASRDATVLIHEATFDDGLEEEALAKRHSLTREAVETGVRSGAFRTILTHFSQRYPKVPVFDDSWTARTCVAFDLMSANLADLDRLPQILPALKLLFKDEMAAEDGEDAYMAPAEATTLT